MIRRPTGSTLTDTRFPYTTRVRSVPRVRARTGAARPVPRRRFGCAHEDCAPIEGRAARCSPSIRQACLALLVLSPPIPIRQAAEEQSHFRLFVPFSLTANDPIAPSGGRLPLFGTILVCTQLLKTLTSSEIFPLG